MPLVSACPKCEAAVLIPDGVGPASEAKCPLCEEQFELADVFSKLPPMLEIIGQPNRPVPLVAAAASIASGASVVDGDVSADESEEGLVEFGSGVFGGIRADADSESTDGDALTLEKSDESADEASESGSGFGSIDFGEMSDGDADGVGVGSESEGGFMPAETGTATASLATKARPKKKGPGPVFFMAGIVGFGIVGLLIGYTILLWIKGSEGDFAGIGKYYPSFIYSDSSSSANNDGEVVANKKPNKPGQNSKKNGDGGTKIVDNSDKPLSTPSFDFGDPADEKDSKKGKKGDDQPVEPIGPTALKQTLRADIEDALDEVAVNATTLGALQAMAEDDPSEGDEGKLSDLSRAVRDHYYSLGTLGLTIASAKPGSLDDEKLKERITQYVHNAVTKVDTFDEIGKKAAIWIDYKVERDDEGKIVSNGRKGRDGVLLAGTIRSIGLKAPKPGKPNVFTAKVQIAGSDKTITVVGGGNPPNAGSRILVLGAIIENPTENLAGYTGDEESVVWLGMAVDAPKEEELSIDDLVPEDSEPEKDSTEEPEFKLPEFE